MLIDPYQWQTVKILEIVCEADNAVSIRSSRPDDYEFRCGAYTVVQAQIGGGRYIRQYSFSHSPDASGLWFTVTLSPGGMVSEWFTRTARPGDTIRIARPFDGSLVIDTKPVSHLGMIAGGSGIAPLMSYIRSFRRNPSSPPWSLLYSTRNDTRCFQNELIPREGENIHVQTTSETARLEEAAIGRYMTSASHVLICGSRSFVKAMRLHCRRQVPNAEVFTEAFTL